jgi:hypothetical protein
MKIRNGFVSNSSSSSFVVAVKKTDACPHCKRSDPNFLDLVENVGKDTDGYEQTQLHARGADNVIKQIKQDSGEYHGFDDDIVNLQPVLEKAEKLGYEIGYIEVSYHDGVINEMMPSLHDRGALLYLWGDKSDLDKI